VTDRVDHDLRLDLTEYGLYSVLGSHIAFEIFDLGPSVKGIRSSHDRDSQIFVFQQETVDDVMSQKTTTSYDEDGL
jgi:hypothetical protein